MRIHIFCITVPSKPLDVQYSFIYDNQKDSPYLRLRWKAPHYTGDSIYSYQIDHFTEEADKPPFPFPGFEELKQSLILDQQDDKYIHFEAIWMDSIRSKKLQKNFTIYAINDNGRGVPHTETTHGI